ncbi:MAG TPA: FtsX-like permease family protein [Urbifossiella sp.]|nr:FtsX-like permease family protein [Urbifossiella sp.]
MTPFGLAWSNLVHKRTRTAVASAGVAFAVALIFMELGMFGGVARTATMLIDGLQFDLILTSSEFNDVGRAADFPRLRLAQARAADGVASVLPLSVGTGTWQKPAIHGWFGVAPPGGVGSIGILGVPPDRIADVFAVDRGRVFPNAATARRAGELLTRRGTLLYDERSKPEFGSLEDVLGLPASGTPGIDPEHPEVRNAVRVNEKRVEVVGGFELGAGFSWNGMLMCSEGTFTFITSRSNDRVTFGLVKLAPGTDTAAAQRQLTALLPSDVRVLTRQQIQDYESRYWMQLTSVGQFLGVAVALAIVVGAIFVYQMMAADIRGMLPEYTTVKALGYRPFYLTSIVMWQALLLAVIGYIPGLIASFGLYYITRTVGGIPTEMTVERTVLVLVMTCGMCLASGALAVRKVHAAQPADLF